MYYHGTALRNQEIPHKPFLSKETKKKVIHYAGTVVGVIGTTFIGYCYILIAWASIQ